MLQTDERAGVGQTERGEGWALQIAQLAVGTPTICERRSATVVKTEGENAAYLEQLPSWWAFVQHEEQRLASGGVGG